MLDCARTMLTANATRHQEGSEAKGVFHSRLGCRKINSPVNIVGSNIFCSCVMSFPLRRRKPDKGLDFSNLV